MHSGKGKVSAIKETNNKGIEETGSKKTKAAVVQKSKNAGKERGRVIKLAENAPAAAGQKANIGAIPDDVIFAMDIGTRSVVGVVGVQEDKCFRIIATEVSEHKSRAMIDGQIHDIEQVALVAAGVKEKLEVRLGIKLKKVAIAAAGRVLRTCQVRVDKNLEQGREIDAELISSLEIEGVQRAQMILDEGIALEDKAQYYCVGYSVINYYLNGFVISKLSGHKGKSMGADVLATFLPFIVVDSLYTVMRKIGLEVSSLTLEPIAAINVTIPPDLRLLNLALVDIGAGTSDIAITKDGSVIAYAMVPQAGDEITEKICRHYLVDFNTGERIKKALSSSNDNITFTDILKIKHSVTRAEISKAIEESIQLLASAITQRIIEYNSKVPNAIFLVGGGSRLPGLPALIAQLLDLPTDRVVVRGRDVIRDIKYNDKKLYGPESITPYGIAITAQMYGGKDFLTVTVNEKKIKLFNSKKLTVADALVLFGFEAEQLIGRSGKGTSFSLNGEKRLVRGEYGKAAELFINGKNSSLDTAITYGDNITVIPAQSGKDAFVKAGELVSEYKTGKVRLNGNPVDISTIIFINGRQAAKDTQVNDGDQVQISRIMTIKDLLEAGGLDYGHCDVLINDSSDYNINDILKDGDRVTCINNSKVPVAQLNTAVSMTHPDGLVIANGIAAISDTAIDESEFSRQSPELQKPTIVPPAVLSTIQPAEPTAVQSAAQSTAPFYVQPAVSSAAQSDEHPADSHNPQTHSLDVQVTVNGQIIVLKDNRAQYIFVDVFNYINFDLTRPQGTIVLKLNGQQAAFTDIIRSGDIIEIYWNR